MSNGVEQALGLRGPLERQVREARRGLPRALRHELDLLAEGWDRARHPKLARHIDRARLRLAHDRLTSYLRGLDAGGRRRALVRDLVQTVSVNLLAALVAAAGIAAWRGLV